MFIRQTYAKVAKSNISIKMNARTNLTKNFSGKFTQTVFILLGLDLQLELGNKTDHPGLVWE